MSRADPLDVLYFTYDGLLEPLGRSQVVSYLAGLAERGLKIAVVSFEKRDDFLNRSDYDALRSELDSRGIEWIALPYHRRPRIPATAMDILRGAAAGARLARRRKPAVVHARSYVAGLMALAATASSGARFVFDMRGFWPEERVELGLFHRHGLLYRTSKLAEKSLLAAADHVVVLTECAKAILREREARARLLSPEARETPITVVPCCVDLDLYRPFPRDVELAKAHGLESALVIGNIGAFNRRYMASEMFRFGFHLKAHRPDVRFVYLTLQDPAEVRKVARAAGLRDEEVVVHRAEPRDVPRWLSLFRLGVFFLRPSYAAKASSFTKLGEFLAAGVPVVTNTGVGDVDRILASDRCGLLLPGLTDRDLSACARKALPLLSGDGVPEETALHCRAAASEHFALTEGVRRYRAVYRSLSSSVHSAEDPAVAAEAS